MENFEINDNVEVINNKPLKGNEHCPKLTIGDKYQIKNIVLDKQGNQHLDIGLKSNLNFVTSYETKEELPQGHLIHWCHPSRFQLIGREVKEEL